MYVNYQKLGMQKIGKCYWIIIITDVCKYHCTVVAG